ncbi:uncharacterized protein [Ptychodera flava]|uniref:uncharacterized protein n=1 Tax=Ptychodera flava TaxID=63121 RepID=UPI00396A5221
MFSVRNRKAAAKMDNQHMDVVSRLGVEGGTDECLTAECQDYKLGRCKQAERCGRTRHTHIDFPPASKWEQCHMLRVGFRPYPITRSHQWKGDLTFEDVICNWLLDHPGNVEMDDLPAYPTTTKTDDLLCQRGIKIPQYIQLLSCRITESLQEDAFPTMLTQFADKYNTSKTGIASLYKAACSSDIPDVQKTKNIKYRPALFRWMYVLDAYRNGELREATLDHLLCDIIEVAALDTNNLVLTNLREATQRRFVVCGQPVTAQSDVEVVTTDGSGMLHIATSVEKMLYTGQRESATVLPQIACDALAVALKSPFGFGRYKTVYQVAVHAVHYEDSNKLEVSVFLIKCYVSLKSLDNLTMCPISNYLEPSYIMHTKVGSYTLQEPGFIILVYKAVKAVLIALNGIEVTE